MELLWEIYKNGTAAFPDCVHKGMISLVLRQGKFQESKYLKRIQDVSPGALYNFVFGDLDHDLNIEE